MKKIEELQILLEKECYKYDTDCTKCPFKKECDEFAELYKQRGNHNDK